MHGGSGFISFRLDLRGEPSPIPIDEILWPGQVVADEDARWGSRKARSPRPRENLDEASIDALQGITLIQMARP